MSNSLQKLESRIISCRACPRLVRWREDIGREKVRRFQNEDYWAKPVPGFGDPKAECLIVGLAPAAHGANRTGRMFTGDKSGEWLYRASAKWGFANQAHSVSRNDGLKLIRCYVTAVVRCAPPQNKPHPDEIKRCRAFLETEISLLQNIRVIIALGKIAFDQTLRALLPQPNFKDTPFKHGATYAITSEITLIGSYHPSQQNTFTGKLTEDMFDDVFRKACRILES